MFIENLFRSGWIHALMIGFVAYPAGYVVQKFVAISGDINILAYICICMLSSSWILLLISGPGRLTRTSLKLPHTWIYSFLEIFVMCVSIAIMIYISATEAAALARTTAVFAFLLSILFLQQPATKLEYLGFFFLIVGFIYATYLINLPLTTKIILVFFVILKNFLQASKKITAEVHKANRKAATFKEELRVAGIIMTVSSVLVTGMLFSIAWCQTHYNINIHNQLPKIEDFMNLKMFLTGCFSGIVLLSVTKYLEFYVSKTLGAKYLMAVASFQIVGLYIFERILSHYSWFEIRSFSQEQLIAIGFILLGNILIALAGFAKDLKFIKKGKHQDTLANMEGNFVDNEEDFKIVKMNLANILTLYENDSKKVADKLETTAMMIDNILNYDLYDVKLNRELAKKINNFASINVSLKDKLTKAYNRYYLEQKTKSLFQNNEKFKLYYLDLNNFKPVNDTYGHDAGDEVLVQTTDRLENVIGEDGFLVRLGGDEFGIVQFHNLEKDLSSLISKSLEKPMSVHATDKKVYISTSIGICDSSTCDNFEEMLEKADINMFKDKDNK